MKKILSLLLSVIFITTVSCSKKTDESDPEPVSAPSVVTTQISEILATSATCGGTITFDGGSAIIQKGTCWSLTLDPKITDSCTKEGQGTGTYVSLMVNLLPDTVYYVRAYATNGAGTGYGNTRSFRTLKISYYGIKDIDGNLYGILDIGTKHWLNQNLRVTRYRNGDSIPDIKNDVQWKALTTGALCKYDNLSSNYLVYGNLYNWYAVNDSRGLCPEGWHVASDDDWSQLATCLGGKSVAGGKLKSTGTIEMGSGLWYAPNLGASDSVRFTGLPGGYRINYGNYYSIGNVAYFWSSSDTTGGNARNFILDANNPALKNILSLKPNGFSVRCCKD